jgi:hypothetical protein
MSAHIRRQYQKLYGLYLAELLQIRSNRKNEDEVELREIASDIIEYSETLPTLKGITAVLLGILSIIGTLFGIINVNVSIEAILSIGQVLAALFFVVPSLIAITYLITPLQEAFSFKRFLFKGREEDLRAFSFDEKKATRLYNSSIYKVEDELFETLGGREQKPKEIPIDIIFHIITNATFICLFLSLGVGSIGPIDLFDIVFSIIFLIAAPAYFAFGIVAYISIYKNRVKARLV